MSRYFNHNEITMISDSLHYILEPTVEMLPWKTRETNNSISFISPISNGVLYLVLELLRLTSCLFTNFPNKQGTNIIPATLL